MTFQSYAIEQRQDYKMYFLYKKKKRAKAGGGGLISAKCAVGDPSSNYLMPSAADNQYTTWG